MGTLKERKSPRYLKRYPVTVKVGTKRVTGFTLDLSSGGMAISAKTSIDVKQIVTLDIKAGRFPIKLMGEVRWTKRAQRADTSKVGYEMGFELQSRNEEYIELLPDELDWLEGPMSGDYSSIEVKIWLFVPRYRRRI